MRPNVGRQRPRGNQRANTIPARCVLAYIGCVLALIVMSRHAFRRGNSMSEARFSPAVSSPRSRSLLLVLPLALAAVAVLTTLPGCSDDAPATATDPLSEHPGKYVTLTDDNFEATVLQADKLVMVDFWAPSCQPCLEMLPWVATISNEYDGRVVVGKLNTDKWKKYGAHYRALTVPQVLFFRNGEVVKFAREGAEVDRLNYCSTGEMREVLDELLARDAQPGSGGGSTDGGKAAGAGD